MSKKKNVFLLGVTSFFTDVSSEMIFAVLPIFLRTVLGAPFAVIGLIEGLAEGASSFLKYFSGWLSDFIKKRKALAFWGYVFSFLSKLFLIGANSWIFVLILRVLDRAGKGIRTSPRDALITESVEARERGKYFGLHRAMDSAGALLGVLLVILIFYLTFKQFFFEETQIAQIIRNIFLIAFLPALLALIPFFFIKDVRKQDNSGISHSSKLFSFKGFPSQFYKGVFVLGILALGNVSYAFFLLKSQAIGVALFLLPLLYLIYNFFYAFFSYPSGKLSDKFGRVKVLSFGFLILSLVFFTLGFNESKTIIWLLFALYGLSLAIVDSVSKAFLADIASQARKGESFGFYYMVVGFMSIAGNLIFGFLWDKINHVFPFAVSGVLVAFSATLLLFFFKNYETLQRADY